MLAIRAGQMFDGERFTDGRVTVLLDDGRVHAVESGWPDLPDATQVIDHPDDTVLPGLIDTHAHLVCDSDENALLRIAGYSASELDVVITEGLRRQLAAGVTTVRDLGDRGFSVLERRDRQRSGQTSAMEPTILAAGPPLTIPAGHCHYMGGEVAGRAEIAAAVDERADRGVDIVKVMASGGMGTPGSDALAPQFSLDDLQFLVDRAHSAGLPVTAHAHALAAVQIAVRAGVDGIEHCSCLTAKGVEVPEELLADLVARGIFVGGFIPMPTMDLTKAPPAIQEMLRRQGITPEQMYAIRLNWLGGLYRAGVRLVTGPDSGIGSLIPHGSVPNAIAFLLDAGASATDALAAATSVAATACGLGDRKGLLRQGFDADIVVSAGDLRETTGALGEPRCVVLDGAVVS